MMITSPAAARGVEGRPLVRSGDRVADRRGRARFVAAFDEFHAIEMAGEDRATLVVGSKRWPWLIPLVRESGAWRFDTGAARRRSSTGGSAAPS